MWIETGIFLFFKITTLKICHLLTNPSVPHKSVSSTRNLQFHTNPSLQHITSKSDFDKKALLLKLQIFLELTCESDRFEELKRSALVWKWHVEVTSVWKWGVFLKFPLLKWGQHNCFQDTDDFESGEKISKRSSKSYSAIDTYDTPNIDGINILLTILWI